MKKSRLIPITAALGTFAVTLSASPLVNAAENPFSMNTLAGGYMVAEQEGGSGETGKCGEGKCGANKEAATTKEEEGKCGEGKCGEKKKETEGKCGEGKCGANKDK